MGGKKLRQVNKSNSRSRQKIERRKGIAAVTNIEIGKLWNHPDNPRRDLGDLTELADSIRAQGVMQNLTVVPWFSKITGKGSDDPEQQEELGYYVVIGNRRLAAAKIAGLTELPCVISNMNRHEQIATMLSENMQRADLTVYEEAQGFQTMIDFGDTVGDIAERTGLSSTTIRRRVKLLELDSEKFEASADRNVTLTDYMELSKIEDIDLRNEVLEKAGTSNFRFELQKALDKEKADKDMAILLEKLKSFATEIDDPVGRRYVRVIYTCDNDKFEKPEDAGTVPYYYQISKLSRYVILYCDGTDDNTDTEDAAAIEKKETEKARRNALDELSKRAFGLRQQFVKNISNTKAKQNISTIVENIVYNMLGMNDYISYRDFADILDIDINEDDEWEFESIVDDLRRQPERYLFVAVYCSLDQISKNYYNWDYTYMNDGNLDRVYDFLAVFGYEESDEEKEMRNGTHELYKTPRV